MVRILTQLTLLLIVIKTDAYTPQHIIVSVWGEDGDAQLFLGDQEVTSLQFVAKYCIS